MTGRLVLLPPCGRWFDHMAAQRQVEVIAKDWPDLVLVHRPGSDTTGRCGPWWAAKGGAVIPVPDPFVELSHPETLAAVVFIHDRHPDGEALVERCGEVGVPVFMCSAVRYGLPLGPGETRRNGGRRRP